MLNKLIETVSSPVFSAVCIVILLILIRSWLKRKAEYMIFSEETDFSGAGGSIFKPAMFRATPRTIDDTITLRPSWGLTLFTPVLVWLAIVIVPWGLIWPAVGITDPKIIFIIYATVLGLLGYIWLWQSIFHHVTYDRYQIATVDAFFRTQSRDLDDLTGLILSQKTPKMIFSNAKPLRVASNLSYKDQFIQDMTARIEFNEDRSAAPRPKGLEIMQSNPPMAAPEPAQPAEKAPDGPRDIPTEIERF